MGDDVNKRKTDRVKHQVVKIENDAKRQLTFSRRRNGLIKKAYELSVLCNIDVALVFHSPNGHFSHFSAKSRIEDVLYRFVSLDHDKRRALENQEYLIRTIDEIRNEDDIALKTFSPTDSNSIAKKLHEEIITLEQQIQMAQEQLSIYEPNISYASAEELESCEKALLKTMIRLIQRKNDVIKKEQELLTHDPRGEKMQMDRMGQIISEGGVEMPSSSFFEGLPDYD
ncbi:agamous-like MADS-box protein AGL66 isoform X1 [Rhododendron vialii]|uniref:agamous-like MADS-box protein AGL66 isoform X1 n=1 Tax=Rhododendron vialii TaxID=182163 RepID=UPI00265F67B7|nr:agamous-like MADS-box protein AGL66 isoform X1 [Rhododendron vialii]